MGFTADFARFLFGNVEHVQAPRVVAIADLGSVGRPFWFFKKAVSFQFVNGRFTFAVLRHEVEFVFTICVREKSNLFPIRRPGG